jgi:hypothetical protein
VRFVFLRASKTRLAKLRRVYFFGTIQTLRNCRGSHVIGVTLDGDDLPGDNRSEAAVVVTAALPVLQVDGEPVRQTGVSNQRRCDTLSGPSLRRTSFTARRRRSGPSLGFCRQGARARALRVVFFLWAVSFSYGRF